MSLDLDAGIGEPFAYMAQPVVRDKIGPGGAGQPQQGSSGGFFLDSPSGRACKCGFGRTARSACLPSSKIITQGAGVAAEATSQIARRSSLLPWPLKTVARNEAQEKRVRHVGKFVPNETEGVVFGKTAPGPSQLQI